MSLVIGAGDESAKCHPRPQRGSEHGSRAQRPTKAPGSSPCRGKATVGHRDQTFPSPVPRDPQATGATRVRLPPAPPRDTARWFAPKNGVVPQVSAGKIKFHGDPFAIHLLETTVSSRRTGQPGLLSDRVDRRSRAMSSSIARGLRTDRSVRCYVLLSGPPGP